MTREGVHATTEYLVKFFQNLILGEKNELKNRHLHIEGMAQSATEKISKCNFCTLDCTLEEIALLDFIKGRPKATQKEMAIHIGKSERTVKTLTVKLSEKGVLERKGGRRSGYWLVNTQETGD